MTMRERLLAVIDGQPVDRVPFVNYQGIAAPDAEVWSLIGRENMGLIRWSAVHTTHSPNCAFETENFDLNGRRAVRTTLHTPAGDLTNERLYEPTYHTTAARSHYVKEPRDYHILLAHLRDVQVVDDPEHFLRDSRDLGEDGVPMVACMRTPWQQLWVQWVSLEDLCLHAVDEPELLAEVTAELTRIELDVFESIRRACRELPIRFVDVPDNITAPTIGPANFRKYCLPLYQRLSEMLSEQDVKVFVHMDGDLKPLWDQIGASGVRGLDSFSPPPDNDTSAAEALAMWPEMRLFMNFPSSVHLAAPQVIYDKTIEILEQAGRSGRLEIQVSENVPPGVWKTSYPQIVKAIRDFCG
jgi:uroporphyrinogen-III decarboxylase